MKARLGFVLGVALVLEVGGRPLPLPEGVGDRSGFWRTSAAGGEAKFDVVREPAGERRLMVRVETGCTHAVWRLAVGVRPHARYRMGGRLRAEGVEGGEALMRLRNRPERSEPAGGPGEWREVGLEFDSGAADSVELEVGVVGRPLARGVVAVERLAIEPVAMPPLPAGAITVEVAAAGAPLDERVYSQFIEHMGRCIYGGIWAEMLEDRKFFYPIRAEYAPYGPGVRPSPEAPFPILRASPWQIVAEGGASTAVVMVTNRPFAAPHAPRLSVGAAIQQRYLEIEVGRRYEGCVWARAEGRGARLGVALEGAVPERHGTFAIGAGDYEKISFAFVATTTLHDAAFQLRADGAPVVIGAVSLMPADHVAGMRRDTLALLRRLRAPIYRWPGGNFVSGYDWRDGIGERDRRPPRANPAWTGVEPNDFGLHEFIRFCREVGAEPLITVNTGFGDAHSAAALLEYANGSARGTYWGRRRAENGAREPFGVRYWCIGNEMWGSWQLGHMKPEHYMLKHNWVVDTMRAVQPDFIAIASGQIGRWDELMLRQCADRIDWIAEHFYCREQAGEMSHVRQIPDAIRRIAEAHRRYRTEIAELAGRDIRVAVTEWNYWYGPHVFGELGTRYFLRDALGIAAGIHEYARQSELITAAFYAQTVNVIGAVKTDRSRAAMETTGWVLAMYREHFLGAPLRTSCGPWIDAQALRSPDGRTVRLGVVNPWSEPLRVPLEWRGGAVAGGGRGWRVAGNDPAAHNDPRRPDVVVISDVTAVGPDVLELPPHSATIVEFPLAPVR
ncbi:MAG: alpha-N-arabinofuranosidase [Kiritimatiellae bacterium]|nr:alpha-N-arabinofuranosidase [Kiritimatiellia bacterium]